MYSHLVEIQCLHCRKRVSEAQRLTSDGVCPKCGSASADHFRYMDVIYISHHKMSWWSYIMGTISAVRT